MYLCKICEDKDKCPLEIGKTSAYESCATTEYSLEGLSEFGGKNGVNDGIKGTIEISKPEKKAVNNRRWLE